MPKLTVITDNLGKVVSVTSPDIPRERFFNTLEDASIHVLARDILGIELVGFSTHVLAGDACDACVLGDWYGAFPKCETCELGKSHAEQNKPAQPPI